MLASAHPLMTRPQLDEAIASWQPIDPAIAELFRAARDDHNDIDRQTQAIRTARNAANERMVKAGAYTLSDLGE